MLARTGEYQRGRKGLSHTSHAVKIGCSDGKECEPVPFLIIFHHFTFTKLNNTIQFINSTQKITMREQNKIH